MCIRDRVYAVCDRITVLRNGTLVGEFKVEELPRVQLVAKMMGKDFDDLAAIKKEGVSTVKEDVIISARGLGLSLIHIFPDFVPAG